MLKKGLLTCLILFGITYAEMKQACEVVYQGDLNDLNDSTVKVPELSVALSGIIKVMRISDSINGGGGPPSVFFVIDNSGSMMMAIGTDQWCQRFTVASWFIDTLMKLYPTAEVGLSIFQSHQFFDKVDEPLFVSCPGYTIGGYLPLLKLNQMYNGSTGQDILRNYLN